jgi:hypothetical protein
VEPSKINIAVNLLAEAFDVVHIQALPGKVGVKLGTPKQRLEQVFQGPTVEAALLFAAENSLPKEAVDLINSGRPDVRIPGD